MVFVTDLDRTMIYSQSFITEENINDTIALQDGTGYSYMTSKAQELLLQLAKKITIVPCTTRSREQFLRLPFFKDCKYAICDNGASLYINGQLDPQWTAIMRKNMEFCQKEIEEFKELLSQQDFIEGEVRFVDNFYLFTKTTPENIHKCTQFIRDHINKEKFYCLVSGIKVYFVPNFITKKHTLGYVLDRIKDNDITVAGDSQIDFGMMEYATIQSFIPIHNKKPINIPSNNVELFHNQGIYAGQNILERVNNIFLELS